MTLSDARLRHLKPKAKACKVSDFDGLYVAVTPNGSKLWRFKYRVDGKEKLLSIGAYPAISLVQARQTRDAARASLAASGKPPTQKKHDRASRQNASHLPAG
ncbi:MAG: Arm DNA-binding domain-containing protein [Rhodobacteraceae bacterium]|nr:Arm DNA-binding domain-containing protein [Paracoccaceae bacterium]